MKYKFESNYVPTENVMSVREEETNTEFIGILEYDVDHLGNVIQDYNQNFK